jgi:hypothetical protein
MRGAELIDDLKKRFRATSDRALSRHLGITAQAIRNWRKRKFVTARMISGVVRSAQKAGMSALAADAIRPVVEFYPIEPCESKQGAKYELFDAGNHPYRNGVRNELANNRGVYIFYDSRGRAIYAGKARQQNLWREMTIAFNRDRGEVQKIKRVRHPSRKVQYRTTEEKGRQPKGHMIPLYDLAAYFSAYAVQDGLINKMEAMLVRSFANDLLNKRMEKFVAKKRGKKAN